MTPYQVPTCTTLHHSLNPHIYLHIKHHHVNVRQYCLCAYMILLFPLLYSVIDDKASVCTCTRCQFLSSQVVVVW